MVLRRFRLYRAQVFETQGNLFQTFPGPSEILRTAIIAAPQFEMKTRLYFVDRVHEFAEGRFIFFLTRRRRVTLTAPDHTERREEDFPFIQILADIHSELFLIELKNDFASDSDHSAKVLSAVISNSDVFQQFQPDLNITSLKDPTEFTAILKRARNIKSFYFDVRRPNTFDASEFKKMGQNLTKELNGQKSRINTDGAAIDADAAEGLTREAASTGDDAGATLRLSGHKKYKRYSLGKNTVDIDWPADLPDSSVELMNSALDRLNSVRDTTKD